MDTYTPQGLQIWLIHKHANIYILYTKAVATFNPLRTIQKYLIREFWRKEPTMGPPESSRHLWQLQSFSAAVNCMVLCGPYILVRKKWTWERLHWTIFSLNYFPGLVYGPGQLLTLRNLMNPFFINGSFPSVNQFWSTVVPGQKL